MAGFGKTMVQWGGSRIAMAAVPGCLWSMQHAMSCKKGGLVNARHNILRDQWHNLLAVATTPSGCTREPRIHMRERRPRPVANRETPCPPALPPQTPTTKEERGNVSCYSFWAKERDTIFDVRITDSDAATHQTVEVSKLLCVCDWAPSRQLRAVKGLACEVP